MISATVLNFMDLAEKTLDWSITGGPSSLGFTSNDNPYISEGWGIVKNIANAILVLGLVVVAITIILGNQGDKAKKNLINFIAIALLINFTPIICGFIIEGANIITASMTTGGISSGYSKAIYTLLHTTIPALSGSIEMKFAYTFIASLFCIFAIVIFFLYAILFVARTVILWILVIISPLAFASFVIKDIPQSKYIKKIFPSVTFWDNWWESFIQWCVIGIPAGFSLYISNKLLVATGELIGNNLENVTGDVTFGTLLSYILPFIFLIVGFFITISTASNAADKLSSELTSWGKKGVGFLGATGAAAAGGAIGAGVGAGRWVMRDPSKDDPNMPPPTVGQYMKAGWDSGKDTIKKEGVVGGALMASNKVIGGVAGAGIGAGKWAVRKKETATEIADLEDKFSYDHATEEEIDEHEEKIRKIKEGGSFKNIVKGEIRNSWGKGGLTEIAETGGQIAGAIGGGVSGAIIGGAKGAWERTGVKKGIKSGGKEGLAIGIETGGTIAGSFGAKVGQVGKNTIKKTTDSMIEKVLEGEKKKEEEEKKTRKEWEKELSKENKVIKEDEGD